MLKPNKDIEPTSIRSALSLLIEGINLSEEQARASMADIMAGKASEAQIAAFLTALRMKGETVEEITGLAREMDSRMIKPPPRSGLLVDTCGTGGDGAGTFNVSTTCAFVVAGAGVQVAKHGNRALSSQCGSADVFEALGIPMRASPLLALEALERVGICFLFAPFFHKAMKHALVPRQQMGVRTVFNLLGPLTNPLHATVRLIGVYSRSFVDKLARVAGELGVARAFVVWGEDGTDEITVAARTYICELENGDTRSYWIQPEDYGITRATREQLAGGAPEQNARMILRILQGQEYGPTRDIVLLNAAYCLLGAGKAHSIEQGLEQARRSIEDRLALDKLQQLRTFYRERLERGTQL